MSENTHRETFEYTPQLCLKYTFSLQSLGDALELYFSFETDNLQKRIYYSIVLPFSLLSHLNPEFRIGSHCTLLSSFLGLSCIDSL